MLQVMMGSIYAVKMMQIRAKQIFHIATAKSRTGFRIRLVFSVINIYDDNVMIGELIDVFRDTSMDVGT
jgi:hypothetical protein